MQADLTILLERLRDGLAPDFRVERELARGGMGAKLTLQVQPFEIRGDSTPGWLGDSVATRLEAALGAISEFQVLPAGTPAGRELAVVLEGTIGVDAAVVTSRLRSVSAADLIVKHLAARSRGRLDRSHPPTCGLKDESRTLEAESDGSGSTCAGPWPPSTSRS